MHCAHTTLVDPNKLKPNPVNPNRHSAHQIQLLASIIQEQGWRNPVTVSKRSGLIVRGHGRLEAALLIGCPTIPVDEQDYASEAEELADLLARHQSAEGQSGPGRCSGPHRLFCTRRHRTDSPSTPRTNRHRFGAERDGRGAGGPGAAAGEDPRPQA
ncbi:MAG: ParB N-terminal domain-containing protein, partial [Akkermansiaceae bacterium]|nr:ParB N-terminal domain-containing protein [Akkermansiaceae bacterium]